MATLHDAARALHGDVVGPESILCPGPGHSLSDRSLSVKFVGGRFVCHSFAGDDWRVCREHVEAQLGGSASAAPPNHAALKIAPDNAARALAIWNESRDPRGTVVEPYLERRGLSLDGAADIRFHPSLWYEGGRTPGMVALMRDVRTGAPCAIHRTFLTRDGRKLGRKMLGETKGAAIQLDPGEGVTHGLAIAEGVESALAARTSFRPVWATGSKAGIAAFPVLPGVECLTIFADNDANSARQDAARACARRWADAKAHANIKMPFQGDANDLLRELAR